MIPWVSPVMALVTLTCPKMGMVGLVTVRVVEPLAVMVAVGPGDQVGVPQTYAGESRPGSGGSSCTEQVSRAGRFGMVTVPPAATVASVGPLPQSYLTVKLAPVPPR